MICDRGHEHDQRNAEATHLFLNDPYLPSGSLAGQWAALWLSRHAQHAGQRAAEQHQAADADSSR